MNQEVFNILILLSGFIVILISSLLILMFYKENEIPAIRKAILPTCCALVVLLLIYIFNLTEVFSIITVLVLVILITMLYPGKINKKFTDQFPESRFDERDIMFSRDELQPGSENYLAYYRKNPGLVKKTCGSEKNPDYYLTPQDIIIKKPS